jgi:hypothetical protein
MTIELALIATLAVATLAGTPKTWTPAERTLSPKTTDADRATYEVLRSAETQDPVDFGIEWPAAQSLSAAGFEFCSIGGRVYEPSVLASHLEARIDGRWVPVRADPVIDYDDQGVLAPIQGRGVSSWSFRFATIQADAIRLKVGAPAHTDPGFQCIALTNMWASDGRMFSSPTPTPRGRAVVFGKRPAVPQWLEPGADLASAAQITKGKAAVVRWRKPVLANCIRTANPDCAVDYEAAPGDWRPVENLCSPEKGLLRFTPIATKALRVSPAAKILVHFDQEGREYFAQVQASRGDMLGARFRSAPKQDLAEMNALLLPIDFTKVAIGRPEDLHETMVMWPGTFLMVETTEALDPQTGAKLPAQAIDRWFAPVAGNAAFGDDWTRLSSHYLDGWMPSVVTSYEEAGLKYTQTVFVTSPDRKLYANVALVEVANPTAQPRQARFAYAMGRRPLYGEPWTPLSQDPLPTGYTLDKDRKTVRDEHGSVILQASKAGKWAGTPRENQLAYSFKLGPGEKQSLAFLIPSVDAPLKSVPAFSPDEELSAFKSYWTNLLKAGAQIDVPEAPINDMYKNLIAQSLIITLDGDQVRYGAYFYESYFGVEEGWPAVALAQFGQDAAAKRIAELMLSPAYMDKANYHHQYRNGLDPWYALTVGRLTQDWAWMQKQVPMIRSCAEWTLKVTGENKDPNYGGLLPKHVYGGDVGMPAFSFYSNATCYRGLHDTAVVLDLLGEKADAERYRAAADTYRKRIMELADRLVDRSSGIPFLPMSFDLDTPSGHVEKEPAYQFLPSHTSRGDTWGYVGNYWNLFAPLLHEVRLFDAADERRHWIPRFIEQRGGILTGLSRFDLGVDHIYTKGYIESLLEDGRREEFLTSLYGVLSNGMSRNLYSSPEVSGIFPLRTDNLAIEREHEQGRWNWIYRYAGYWIAGWQNQEGEPTSAGAGMALQLLRMALVREDFASDPPQRLLLLDGAPSHWFEKGKHVAVKDMRTFFGRVSFRVDSLGNSCKASLSLPDVDCALRLPHPAGLALKSVTVNGKPWTAFKGNEVTGLRGKVRLEARFGK